MDDLPILKKRCFCVTLLTWGYIKLGIVLLVLSMYIMTLVMAALAQYLDYLEGDTLLNTIITLVGVLLATETITNIVLIIGAHAKNVKLLKVYYYYAIFIWMTIIAISIISTIHLILIMGDIGADSLAILFSAGGLSIVFSVVVQTFLVLSTRREIIKLRSNCPYRFVKNDNDPEGTINSVRDEEELSIDNGTFRML